MIQSMTGFGSAERDGFRVEIRSLNHRFLEIALRLPPFLGKHEMELREILKKRFGRGKLDVYVSSSAEGQVGIRVNRAAAEELHSALKGLKDSLSIPGEVDLGAMLVFRELFIVDEVSYDTDTVKEALYGAFNAAVDEVERMRLKEGSSLSEDVLSRAVHMESLADDIAAKAPGVMEAVRAKFLDKMKSLLAGYDEARLIQEASVAAGKGDITEEITRLKSHVKSLKTEMSGEGELVGRKIDFILQELHREANTIASKTDDFGVISLAVELKAEIEKVREQIQNIQ